MNENANKVIILAGPTGVGKTSASIELAQKLNGEIISADSMQIYQQMDIGTAKIRPAEMQNVPHHLMDIVSPFDRFSVAEYRDFAQAKIKEIQHRGKTPIVVGGTGLYINALIYDMDFNDTVQDEDYRKYLWNLYYEQGEDALYTLLIAQAPDAKIEKQNIKRVIRALEVLKQHGKLGDFSEIKDTSEYDYKLYVLTRDRETLYKNINLRVDIMFEAGLVEEVQKLKHMGLDAEYQSMKGIGYRQMLEYLNGQISLEAAKEKIKQESRRYAKRQLTWFRRYKNAIWIHLIDK